jgi:hypothetical protein
MRTYRRGPAPRPLLQRFLSHVRKDTRTGCWLWVSSAGRHGYGVFRDTRPTPNVTVTAHRMAWSLFRGPIPTGLWVLHTCESAYPPGDITYRRCVNPDHLKVGTVLENNGDSARTGRRPKTNPRGGQRGERHHSAQLTEDVVREARMWRTAGVTYSALASVLGVDPETVRDAVRYRTWRHVP